MSKGWLHFTQGEKRAVLLLMIFILVFITGYLSFSFFKPKAETVIIQRDTIYRKTAVKTPVSTEKTSSKYTERISIDLNRADTSQLKKIPGIGSVYARSIVEYRNSLGGYHSLEQLTEIKGIGKVRFAELQKWLYIRPNSHKLIRINRATFNELNNHPYFNISLIRPIKEFQKDSIRMECAEDFYGIHGFGEKEIVRLTPYLSFGSE